MKKAIDITNPIYKNGITLYSAWSDYDDSDAYLKYYYGCLHYKYRYICGDDVHYGGSSNKETTVIKINRKNTIKYIDLLGEDFLISSREKFYGFDVNDKFKAFLDDNDIEYDIEETVTHD